MVNDLDDPGQVGRVRVRIDFVNFVGKPCGIDEEAAVGRELGIILGDYLVDKPSHNTHMQGYRESGYEPSRPFTYRI